MNKQLKAISIQWIGPTAVLMLALVIMLVNFSTKSEVSANNTVTRSIVVTAEKCAHIFNDEITLMEKVGIPIAEIIASDMKQKEISSELSYEIELLQIAQSNSGAYMAYLCDEDGNAINDMGESLSIADKDFYELLYDNEGVRYLHTTDDGVSGHPAVVTAIPIKTDDGKRMDLLLLYDLDNLRNVVKGFDFNSWNMESIVDREGEVLLCCGSNSYWNQGDNIYELMKEKNPDIVKRIKSHINGSTSALIAFDEESALVYSPFGEAGWTVMFGISQSYIDRQVEQQWLAFKNMVYQLVIVFCVFIFLVVTINIISKVYNNKKQKQLESKADTDLLTGLNNKIATERKIKEFIEQNPQSQSMMFILDIDNFKKINDTMGHAFGDEVLRSLGQQIRVIFRASDIVGRAGGDEFIIFLKNISEIAAIKKEAKKVEDFFKDFKAGEYTKYSATASIGVAIFPREGADFESIYKAADSALYKAKKRGKNQLAFYDEEWLGEKKE